MKMWLQLGVAGLIAWQSISVLADVRAARSGSDTRRDARWVLFAYTDVARGVRARHLRILAWTVPVAVMVAVVSQIPGADVGWWGALSGDESSLAVPTVADPGVASQLLTLAVVAVVVALTPPLALLEEMMFRAGAETRSVWRNTARTVVFGAVHLAMGIPVAAAAGVGVLGWALTRRYLWIHDKAMDLELSDEARELRAMDPDTFDEVHRDEAARVATVEAARYHLAWNWALLAVFFVGASVDLIV